MRKVPEGQGALDFEGPPRPAPREWKWEWWDPFPAHWDHRQCLMGQIARDMRAIEEAEADGPGFDDMVPFFRARIESFRRALTEAEKKEGGDAK